MDKEYSREELIKLCEKAIVLEKNWIDRDSSYSQKEIGEAWALLKAGCDFRILREGCGCTQSDEKTIWIEINYCGVGYFEGSGDLEKPAGKESETYYIPTEKRLKEANGDDWY